MTRERNSLGRVSPDTYQKEYSSNMALSNEDTIAHDVCTKLELFKNKDMYGLFKARLNNKFFNSELSDSLRELRDLSEQVIIPAKLEEFNKKYSEVAKTIREDLLMEAYRVNKNDLKKNKNSEKVQTYLKGVQNLLKPDQKQSPDEYIYWRLEKMRYDFGTFCLRADPDKLLQADKKVIDRFETLKEALYIDKYVILNKDKEFELEIENVKYKEKILALFEFMNLKEEYFKKICESDDIKTINDMPKDRFLYMVKTFLEKNKILENHIEKKNHTIPRCFASGGYPGTLLLCNKKLHESGV